MKQTGMVGTLVVYYTSKLSSYKSNPAGSRPAHMGDTLAVWNRTILVPVKMCKVAGDALAPKQRAVLAEKLARSGTVAET